MNNKSQLYSISKISKKEIIELLCLPIVGLAFFSTYLKFKNILVHHDHSEEILTSISSVMFGLVHILASNALAFLYNTNKVFIPLQPLATPKRLKILGLFIVGVSVLIFMKNY